MNVVPWLIAFGLLLTRPLVAAETWTGDPALAAQELEAQWPQIAHPGTLPIRGTVHFALEAAGIGWHPERVEVALQRAQAMQDLDRSSRTYGNFKWRSDQERVFDPNGVEFSMQMLGLMRLRYGAQLTPEVRAKLDEIMVPAIDGIRAHRVKVEYTNIFVMKSWNLIAAGESLGRPAVAEEGYRQFDEWLHYTARHGIVEYDAVTYYGIDLDSLVLISKFAGRADVRQKALAAIRYLWTDVAANWWAPGDRLGSANSRSYDYLFGHGYLEAHTWTAGWLRTRPDLERANWLPGPHDNQIVLRAAATFVPPTEWTASIRSTVPRIVVQRWGEGPEHQAVNWVGRTAGLASSGASHESDERTLVADLGDSPAIPQLTLFMDGRGDPFGTKKTANAAAQSKALHLTPFIATVQQGAEVLQVLSDEPRGPKSKHKPGELSCFLTHLTLPAVAEVWIGDARQPSPAPGVPTPIPLDAPVYIRLGQGVVAVRFLAATTDTGERAPIEFVTDDANGPARRITVVHAAQEPRGRGTVVVYLRAGDGLDDAQFAAFRKTFARTGATATLHGTVVSAKVAGQHGPMRIEAEIAKGERRVLQGGEPDALLSVNGQDVGRAVWGELAQP